MSAINELTELDKWIYAKLAADATINSEVGTHPTLTGLKQIYSEVAPQDASGKYIVFSGIGNARAKKSDQGAKKIFITCRRSILVWTEEPSFSVLETAANRIEDLFKVDQLRDDDAIVAGCSSRELIKRVVNDDGKLYRCMGSVIDFFVYAQS